MAFCGALCGCLEMAPNAHCAIHVNCAYQPLLLLLFHSGRERTQTHNPISNTCEPAVRNFESLVTSIAASRFELNAENIMQLLQLSSEYAHPIKDTTILSYVKFGSCPSVLFLRLRQRNLL